MIYIIIVTQVLMVIIAQSVHVNRLAGRILSVFSILWMVLIVMNAITPLGGYVVSQDAYILFWIFLVAFSMTFLFSKSISKNKNFIYDEKKIVEQYDAVITFNPEIQILLCCITILLLIYSLRYRNIMTSDTYLNARNERFFVGHLFTSTIEILFYNYFISMCRYLLTFIIAFSVLFGRMKTVTFAVSLLDLLLYSYIGSGRWPMVLLIVDVFILWLIKGYYSSRRFNLKRLKSVLMMSGLLFIGIFAMLYMTAFRRGTLSFDFNSLVENIPVLYDQIIGYNIGPLSGFSYLLDQGYMYNHLFYGRAVLMNGIAELFSHAVSFLGFHTESAKFVLAEISNVSRIIGTGQFNALYTCVYWFFSDFGYIGVVLFSALFGWVEKKVVGNFYFRPNIITLMLITHALYFMFMSHMIWQINNVDSLLYLLMLFFLSSRLKKNSILEKGNV